MTGPPPIIDAENWSKTFGGFIGWSDRRSPSILGLWADWIFVAMMGGKGPWKEMAGCCDGESPLQFNAGRSLGGMGGRMISGALSLRRSPPPKNRWSRPVSPACCGLECGGDAGRFNAELVLRFSNCGCWGRGRLRAELTLALFNCSSCWRRCCSESSWSPGRCCPADGCSLWSCGPWGTWCACGCKGCLSWYKIWLSLIYAHSFHRYGKQAATT